MARIPKELQRPKAPIVLALETATICGSIALVAEDHCFGEYSLQSSLTHSRRLLAGIDALMQETALTWEDIDGLAVSLGPGSFTGLRIGLSTAKGLALAADKPLIGVPTLDGLACQLFQAPLLICPVFDARKKEVYAALYRWTPSCGKAPARISEYLAIAPEQLCARLDEPVIMAGDGLTVYRDLFQEQLAGRLTMAPAALFYPRAAAIGQLAVARWQSGDFDDPAGLGPLYVRPSEAEVHYLRRAEKNKGQ